MKQGNFDFFCVYRGIAFHRTTAGWWGFDETPPGVSWTWDDYFDPRAIPQCLDDPHETVRLMFRAIDNYHRGHRPNAKQGRG